MPNEHQERRCAKCGLVQSGGVQFCPQCGARLGQGPPKRAKTIQMRCPKCGKEGRLSVEGIGKPIACPSCGARFTLVAGEKPGAPAAPAASAGRREAAPAGGAGASVPAQPAIKPGFYVWTGCATLLLLTLILWGLVPALLIGIVAVAGAFTVPAFLTKGEVRRFMDARYGDQLRKIPEHAKNIRHLPRWIIENARWPRLSLRRGALETAPRRRRRPRPSAEPPAAEPSELATAKVPRLPAAKGQPPLVEEAPPRVSKGQWSPTIGCLGLVLGVTICVSLISVWARSLRQYLPYVAGVALAALVLVAVLNAVFVVIAAVVRCAAAFASRLLPQKVRQKELQVRTSPCEPCHGTGALIRFRNVPAGTDGLFVYWVRHTWREPCQNCGGTGVITSTHRDYVLPLDGVWQRFMGVPVGVIGLMVLAAVGWFFVGSLVLDASKEQMRQGWVLCGLVALHAAGLGIANALLGGVIDAVLSEALYSRASDTVVWLGRAVVLGALVATDVLLYRLAAAIWPALDVAPRVKVLFAALG